MTTLVDFNSPYKKHISIKIQHGSRWIYDHLTVAEAEQLVVRINKAIDNAKEYIKSKEG